MVELMSKLYECQKTFYIDKYDEDGFCTNQKIEIKKGSKWEHDEKDKSMIIGNYNDHVHLERMVSPRVYRWIEISKEEFEKYFKEVKDGGRDEQKNIS